MEQTVDESIKDIAYKVWCSNDIRTVLPIKNKEKIKEYNDLPLFWCNACKSLEIINCETELNSSITCFCNKCNGTDIKEGNIKEWLDIINKIN